MRLGGRISAAQEVLVDVLDRRTPVAMALRDWGKAHRFAGSKDRSAIGNIVHDALRHRLSIGHRMNDASARALALGAVVFHGGIDLATLFETMEADTHAPDPLSETERKNLAGAISLDDAPDHIRADVPDWIWPAFENNFTDDAVKEGQALTARPPLDLRFNTIKGQPTELDLIGGATDISPVGWRLPAISGDGRHPNVQSDAIYMTGQVEIQDEGSQIVSLLVAAQPGETVLDYCAGGGGKSLALAADMNNQGEVHAYDIDKRRLAPLYQRAQRAGASCIQVHAPDANTLGRLAHQMDRVLVDAPCTGVGTWRRKPDAKWRLTEDALGRRLKEQRLVLDGAKEFVRPGGLLFYVTCSMLAEENEQQVYDFLERTPGYTLLSAGEVWEERFGTETLKPWSEDGLTVTLTPASTNTDGFFFAVMEKDK